MPNVAEDVGVCLRTVKNILNEMKTPEVFERKCDEFERNWSREKRSGFYLEKAIEAA